MVHVHICTLVQWQGLHLDDNHFALCDLQEALYDTPVDGKLLTPKGSLYRHQEYDDVADRPYEAPPKKESKIYDYLQRKDLFKLKRDQLK